MSEADAATVISGLQQLTGDVQVLADGSYQGALSVRIGMAALRNGVSHQQNLARPQPLHGSES